MSLILGRKGEESKQMKIFPTVYKTSRAVLVAMMITLFGACSTRQTDHGGRLHVTATIAPATDLIRRLGDTLVYATTLLPQGNSPESYEPTPQTIQALATSRAYYYMGDLGFERSWVERIQSLHPELRLVRLDAGLDTLRASQHRGDHLHDPHYWTSMRGLRTMSRTIYRSLCQIDSVNSPAYTASYEALGDTLAQLEQTLRTTLSALPSRAFLIYHPSLSDFACEWGLEQLVVEEDGKDPTPQHLERLLQRAKALGVRVVFIQKEFDTKLTESLANELGAQTVEINPLDGDWKGQLLRIARALSASR